MAAMVEQHTLMDGKVHVYRRENSRFWQCAIYLGRRNYRQSTKQETLALALEWAREWSMDRLAEERLRKRGVLITTPGEAAVGMLPSVQPQPERPKPGGKTFREAAETFIAEFEVVTQGERNAEYVASKSRILERHLLPFFGDKALSEITAGAIAEYRVHRVTPPSEEAGPQRVMQLKGRARLRKLKVWKRPARNTLHSEIVCLRQVLKAANRRGWIAGLPDMSAPYKASGKVAHRAWFSPDEYKQLYQATRERARKPSRERWRAESEQLHDYILFMVNTGLRPDEASRVETRDVSVVVDQDTNERILEIAVRGKRGVGYCKSMPGAVLPFQRVVKRNQLKPTDLLFGRVQRELLNNVLNETGLKRDREGNLRTAYSLRHTYICLRLMEGADIYQVAKNCRTSVEMIEKFYAVHLKDTLDASAINVRKVPRPRKVPSAGKARANA